MGYFEIYCHICCVSFNIGRIRRPDEPRGAAWNPSGPILARTFLADYPGNRRVGASSYVSGGVCQRDSGCMYAMRKIKDEGRKVIVSRRRKRTLAEKCNIRDEDDEDDGDWVDDDERDDEPLEYVSDVEENMGGESSDVEEKKAAQSNEVEMEDAERDDLQSEWIRALMVPRERQDRMAYETRNTEPPAWYRGYLPVEIIDEVNDEMFPLFCPKNHGTEEDAEGNSSSHNGGTRSRNRGSRRRQEDDLGYDEEQSHNVEHIAGPGCVNEGGYSGHNISAEEMRGCQVSQCLVRKPQNWTSDPLDDDEDEDFEKTGAFFLSGLSDYMPAGDVGSPHVQPARHGCKDPYATNTMWEEDNVEQYAMPFHPSCFEVFKRASMLEHAAVDVNGLTSWWEKNANYCFGEHTYGSDVYKCRYQMWSHCNGTEYLAANPLYIPKLREILRRVTATTSDSTPRNGAFLIREISVTDSSNDPFARLPAELKFGIIDSLHSKDIASLRLASRAFRQLPISYFQNLINREMPWLWEAWPTPKKLANMPYSFWAMGTALEAETKLQERQRAVASLDDYVKIISEEMPELKSVLEEALPANVQAVLDAQKLELENDEDRRPFFLPPDRTDYYLLYVLLKRHWAELRGLQNRERIWKECQWISQQVKQMRSEGVIGPLDCES